VISKLFRYKGGLHLPDHKAESTTRPIQKAVLPERLILPLQQHIGVPATPMVKVGDRVLKGQKIARCSNHISAPVHAPTSGIVVEIGEYQVPHPSGLKAQCIVIEVDGNDAWCDHRAPVGNCHDYTPEEIREHIRVAGIVGLGGAGFPSFLKLTLGRDRVVETLILNGAECEPYITCDDMLMRERPEEILKGLMIMKHALMAKSCVIGIEDNKPEACQSLREAIDRLGFDVQVVEVPTRYPTGGEKQLIKILTGKEVPGSRLPIEQRVVVHNVATAAAVYRAICLGEPLISRVVTITGAVETPCNLEVAFGTPVDFLVQQCGGNLKQIEQIIKGGPMMGYPLPDVSVPVTKTTNCLLATSRDTLPIRQKNEAMPCIRCGSCADVCPVNLLPQQLYWYSRAKEFDKAQDYNLFDCIECGCCDYVCPSQIPLVQYFRFAKTEIWNLEREKKKSELARNRHEFRQFRLEREKEEKAARHKAKAAAIKTNVAASGEDDEKKKAIQAAMERVKAKKQEQEQSESAEKPAEQ
jgi:electron transport complex protein RnfC